MRKNSLVIILLTITTLVLVTFVAFSVPEEDLKGILVTLAQLNVAIAVGIGALSIGYAKDRRVQSKLTEATLLIVIFSLLTFLVAHVDLFLLMNKIYLILNMFVICTVLILTLFVTQEDKE